MRIKNKFFNLILIILLMLGFNMYSFSNPISVKDNDGTKINLENFILGVADFFYENNKENEELMELFYELKKVFEKLGYNLQIRYLPPERSIWSANIGIIDGEFPRVKNVYSLYSNLLEVEEPLITAKFYAYTISGQRYNVTWDVLRVSKVASSLGTKITEKNLKNQMKEKGIYHEAVDFRGALRMLNAGRVEYVVMSENLEIQLKDELIGVRKIEPPLEIVTMHLLLNKKHIDILDKVSEELKLLRSKN